jgi:hypothetical protein
MTQDETIELARQAGAMFDHITWVERDLLPVFERFAVLVAQHERETCIAHAMTSAEKAIDVAIKLEREACAKIVEESSLPDTYSEECLPDIANEIRARGHKGAVE